MTDPKPETRDEVIVTSRATTHRLPSEIAERFARRIDATREPDPCGDPNCSGCGVPLSEPADREQAEAIDKSGRKRDGKPTTRAFPPMAHDSIASELHTLSTGLPGHVKPAPTEPSDGRTADTLDRIARIFTDRQVELPADARRVLEEHLHDLYIGDPVSEAPPTEPSARARELVESLQRYSSGDNPQEMHRDSEGEYVYADDVVDIIDRALADERKAAVLEYCRELDAEVAKRAEECRRAVGRVTEAEHDAAYTLLCHLAYTGRANRIVEIVGAMRAGRKAAEERAIEAAVDAYQECAVVGSETGDDFSAALRARLARERGNG